MKITLIQTLIDILRNKKKQNYLKLKKENDIQISEKILDKITLSIKGKNNTVIIEDIKGNNANIHIRVFGDSNRITIGKGFSLSNKLEIVIGQDHQNFGKVENCIFSIGKNTSIESVQYVTFNSNSFCNIGNNCMFSYDITLFNTDAHPIFDRNTNKIINYVKGISIGNHCWIGRGATILKNSSVPNDSIIGINSVYSGNPYLKEGDNISHCVFAGNPAKLIKQNVTWNPDGNKFGYINNQINE